jgi:hypothetical protein
MRSTEDGKISADFPNSDPDCAARKIHDLTAGNAGWYHRPVEDNEPS